MIQALLAKARQLFEDLNRSLLRPRPAVRLAPAYEADRQPLRPLRRVLLADEVSRTLFEEYARHRSATHDETGWLLMGVREADAAVVLATLPAGAGADASETHVRFNSIAQAVASRIVRQKDRRLTIVGIVHTHPGSLRHPSSGDLTGDSAWVGKLRGKEGVFGIGTTDGTPVEGALYAWQPRPHMHCWGDFRFTWYSLGHGDSDYRTLPVELTHGPDMARELHPLWSTLERHGDRLERLFVQQQGMRCEAVVGPAGPALVVTVPLAERGWTVQAVLRDDDVRFYVVQGTEVQEVKHQEEAVDRGIYLLLAELAVQQKGS
jgi:proteasome lid subunit RPN8/RPN11